MYTEIEITSSYAIGVMINVEINTDKTYQESLIEEETEEPTEEEPTDEEEEGEIDDGDKTATKPCVSDDGLKANPLFNIQVLGTKNNGIDRGIYKGGRGRFYDGIAFDLVEIGTPVYAMFNGTIDFSITDHTEGENWKDKETWSAGPHLHLRGRKNRELYNPIEGLTEINLTTGIAEPCN